MADNEMYVAKEDYAAHQRTFHGFVHVSAWFVIHTLVILVGLYVLGMQGMAGLGAFIIAAGVVALGYGAATAPRAARKAAEAEIASEEARPDALK